MSEAASDDTLARALALGISELLRQFKLEPGMLAGSAYADLHANDVGLLMVLAGEGAWTVRGVAQALSAPDSTVSSALDRLEGRGLVERSRLDSDRRVMRVALTAEGRGLAERLRAAQIDNCRTMLGRLAPEDRDVLVRLVTEAARPEG